MYRGPERRLHRIMVTRNSEYHLRGSTCVAVSDPDTHAWRDSHRAIGCQLVGGIAFLPGGGCNVSSGSADVGQQLCFSNDLMTTLVTNVVRPPRDVVESYPHV